MPLDSPPWTNKIIEWQSKPQIRRSRVVFKVPLGSGRYFGLLLSPDGSEFFIGMFHTDELRVAVIKEWDGVPPNPEVTGWHWLRNKSGGELWPFRWDVNNGGEGDANWDTDGTDDPDTMRRYWVYVAPCPEP